MILDQINVRIKREIANRIGVLLEIQVWGQVWDQAIEQNRDLIYNEVECQVVEQSISHASVRSNLKNVFK